jgi:hypothetical protein
VAILIWSTWLHLIYFFHNKGLECSPARVHSPMAGQAQIPVPRQARAYRRTAAKAILFESSYTSKNFNTFTRVNHFLV